MFIYLFVCFRCGYVCPDDVCVRCDKPTTNPGPLWRTLIITINPIRLVAIARYPHRERSAEAIFGYTHASKHYDVTSASPKPEPHTYSLYIRRQLWCRNHTNVMICVCWSNPFHTPRSHAHMPRSSYVCDSDSDKIWFRTGFCPKAICVNHSAQRSQVLNYEFFHYWISSHVY